MPVWIAIALQAAPLGGTPPAGVAPPSGSPDQATGAADQPAFSILRPRCDPGAGADDVVVCGRLVRGPGQRLERLDARFAPPHPDEDGLFSRRLSDRATLGGGGPKRSVGMTLRVGF